MKLKINLKLLIALLLFSSPAAMANKIEDEAEKFIYAYIDKARSYKDLNLTSLEETETIYDNKHKEIYEKNTSSYKFKAGPGKNNPLLISLTKNGKKEKIKGGEKLDYFPYGEHLFPFLVDEEPQVKDIREASLIDGQMCVPVLYEQKIENYRWKGELWISEKHTPCKLSLKLLDQVSHDGATLFDQNFSVSFKNKSHPFMPSDFKVDAKYKAKIAFVPIKGVYEADYKATY